MSFRQYLRVLRESLRRGRRSRRPAARRAARPAAEALEDRTLLSSSLPLDAFAWTPLGPSPLTDFTTTPPTPYSGRVTGIAPSPTDPNTIYLAAAGGGVWKTADGGADWVPLTDNQATTTTGAIALDPAHPNVIYAGTGEANFSVDSNYGKGILVSKDGGATWKLTGTVPFNNLTVSQIAVDPSDPTGNTAYAAISRFAENAPTAGGTGIWKTTDGGTTWTDTTATISTTDPYTDVLISPADPKTLYMAVGHPAGDFPNGVYESNDGGATWGQLVTPLSGLSAGRIRIAISPSSPQTLYVSVANPTTFKLAGLWRSDDGGGTWIDQTTNVPEYMKGDGWYDTALAVDPTDPTGKTVYVGGAAGPNSIEFSNDGGKTWYDLSGTGAVPFGFHHAFAFTADGKLLDGDDGGIFRLEAPTTTPPPVWTDLNGNLEITPFNGIGLDPTDPNQAVAGAQGLGAGRFNDSLTWALTDSLPGSAGPVRYSPTKPNRVYHSSISGGPGFFRRSDDGGLTWATKTAGIAFGLTPPDEFTPYAVDPNNGSHVLLGTDRINETTTGGDTWVDLTNPFTSIGWNPNDLAVDAVALAPSDPKTIYATVGGDFATASLLYVTTDHGVHWTNPELPEGVGRIGELVVDPNNAQTVYAVVSTAPGSHVIRTTDGGLHWQDISGNLPQVPTWSLALDPSGPVLYVGSDAGVWVSASLGASWVPLGTGLPSAQVVDVALDTTNQILGVATHGRGLWELNTVDCKAATNASALLINCGPLNDNVNLKVAAGQVVVSKNGQTIGSFPVGSFTSIAASMGGGDDTLTVDFSGGSPVPPGGLSVDGGGIGLVGNSLVLENGTFANDVLNSPSLGSGTITLDDGGPPLAAIFFTNVQRVDDTLKVNRNLLFEGAAAQPVSVADQPAPIDGVPATQVTVGSGGVLTTATVNVGNKQLVAVEGLGGGDTFTVNDPSPAGLAGLAVVGPGPGPGIAASTFNVQDLGTATTVAAGSGRDTVNLDDVLGTLNGITFPLAVFGNGGTTTLNATNDSNFTLTNSSLVAGPANVTLNGGVTVANLTGGPGNNRFTLLNWSGGGSLTGLGGTDTVAVTNDASFVLAPTVIKRSGLPDLALSGIEAASLTGGPGNNNFDLSSWTGPGTVAGGGGSDTLTVSRDVNFTLADNQLQTSDGSVVALSAVGAADLTGGKGDNTFNLTGWTGAGSLDGGGGSNTLVAGGDTDFTLTNAGLARIGRGFLNLARVQVADLTGGPGNNTFDLSGWTGTGALAGGGGSDTVTVARDTSYTLSNTALTTTDGMSMALTGFAAANLSGGPGDNGFTVSGWTGFGSLTGNGGSDSVTATKAADFTLGDKALSSSDGMSLALSGIHTASLTGGPGNDLFDVSGWTGTGALDGGGGSDTVAATKDANLTLANFELTSGDGMNLGLTGFAAANLTAGPGGHTFDVGGWTGSGSLTGTGGGSDTVSATKNASFTLTDGRLTGGDGMTMALAGVRTARLTGGPGAAFDVSGWTGAGTLSGLGGSDVVVASNNVDFTLTNASLARSGLPTLALANISAADLTAGPADHAFDVSGWTGIGALAGDGNATVTATKDVNFSLSNTALSSSDGMSLTLSGFHVAGLTGGPGNNLFTIGVWGGTGTLTGGGGSDTVTAAKDFDITLADGVLKSSDGTVLTLSGIRIANLTGGPGNNTFDVTGWTGGGSLDGVAGTDTVVARNDVDFTLSNGALARTGLPTLKLANIEVAKLTSGPDNHAFDVSGWTGGGALASGGGSDTITAARDTNFTLGNTSLKTADGMNLALTGFTVASLTGGPGNNNYDVSGWTGTGTLNAAGGSDTVTATKNTDFTLTNTSLATGDGMRLTLNGVVNAALTGGAGNNTFNVIGWTGGGTVTGGGGSDTITAVKDANFSLSNTTLTSSDGMGLTLSGIGTANLTGGPGNNLFAIGVWSGTGSLNGGGGSDTVTVTKDFNITLTDGQLSSSDGTVLALSGIRTANLNGGPGNNLFDVSGWTGGGSLNGVGGSDTVVASDGVDFSLSNTALARSGLPTLGLANVENANLSAPAGNHTFDVGGWTGGGSLAGGGGSDTVTAAHDTNFTLADRSLGAADGLNLALSGIGTASLTGGPGNNAFDVSGWTGTGTLNGAGGSDTVTATKDTNFTLTNSSLVTGDKMSLTLNGIGAADLTGGPGNNLFDLTGWTGGGSLAGGGGSDTVAVARDTNFTLSDTALSTSDGMSLALSAIGAADLTGGASNNLFAVGAWSGTGSLTGGGGSDTLTVTKDSNFTLTDAALTGTGGLNLALSSIGTAVLTGGPGNNLFDVSGWTGGGSLNGVSGSDTVVASGNVDFTLSSAVLGRSGLPTLALANIQNAQLTAPAGNHAFAIGSWSGAVSVTGGGGSDTVAVTRDANFTLTNAALTTSDGLSVTLSGVGTANLTGGPGNNLFNVTGWTGAGSLAGGGGSDTVAATRDTNFTLSDTALTTADGMNLALAGIGTANLAGGPGNNTFDVSGWTGGGSLNGLGGTDTVLAQNDGNFTLTNAALARSGRVTLTLAGIGAAGLTGGAGANTFDVSGWTGTGTLTGGGGSDTVAATKDANFSLSDTALSTTDGMALTLAGVRGASLAGVGTGTHTFGVGGWTATGSLTGGGSDTVTATKNADFTLADTALQAGDGLNLTLAGVTTATLAAGPGAHTFTVSGWSGAGSLTAANDNGTVAATKSTNFTLGNAVLKSPDGLNLTLSGVGTANLDGGPNTNTFTVSSWTGKGSLTGDKSDTVVAAKDTNFTLTDAALTTADGMSLLLNGPAVANLTGGKGNNAFVVGGWTGKGSLNGGGGSDTVSAAKDANFSLSDTALSSSDGMSLGLNAVGTALLTGGAGNNNFTIGAWSGAATVTGGGGTDSVTVTRNANFTLTNAALTTSDGLAVGLSGIGAADLTGGPGNNTFNVTGWTGGGALNGGGGSDTVTATRDTDFTLANTSLKTADGMNLALGAVGTANLAGGTGNNTFDVSGWTGNGTVTGGGSSDTVSATKDVNFTLANATLTSGDGMSLALNGIGAANLTGGADPHTFDVSAWTKGGSLTGVNDNATVLAAKDTNFTLSNAALSTGDGMTLALNGVGAAVLTSGPNNDTFDVGGWTGGGSLAGGGGRDTVAAGHDTNFTLADASLRGSDGLNLALSGIGTANLTGGAGANTFDVSGWSGNGTVAGGGGSDTVVAADDADFALSNTTLVRTGRQPLTLQGIAAANLTGGAGNNTFDVSGWTGSGLLNGGGGGTDQVVVSRDASFALTDTAVSDSAGLAMGLQAIPVAVLTGGPSGDAFTVSQWGGSATLHGGAGANSYAVTFKGSGSGTVTVADQGTSGASRLSVNGTALGDAITVTPTQVTRAGETVNFSGVPNLAVHGGSGANTIAVNASPAAALSLSVDGGPSGSNTLSVVDVTGGGVVHGSLASGQADVHYLGGAETKISFVNVQRLTLSPGAEPSYVQSLLIDVFGRTGSAAELQPLMALMDSPKGGRRKLVRQLELSPEGRLHAVASWFLQYAGGPAGPYVEAHWATQLKGNTEEQVLSRLLVPVFASQGGAGKAAFLQVAGKTLFGRSLTTGELRRFGRALARGRSAALLAMLKSPAYRTRLVTSLVRQLFRVPAGQPLTPDLQALVSQFSGDKLDQRNIRIALETSDAFFNRG